jgi:hypothetical protein
MAARPHRHELDPRRHQLPRDDLQDARPGHDPLPDADPRLDRPRDERPRPHGDARSSRARSSCCSSTATTAAASSTPRSAADAILYQNIFWFYSHPAVYIMILPAMGMISEILPVFSRKPLFGYKAFVFATAGIGALGFSVWAHHMFTTGAVFLPFFSLMTFLIAVPTGVKMFNWIFTMWRGQLTFSTPLLYADRLPVDVPHRRHQRRVQRRRCRSTSRSTTPTGWSPTSTTSCSAAPSSGLRGPLLLVPEDDRPDAGRGPGQGPVRAHVHRLQPDVLPDAPARPRGHAPPDRRLRRDGRLERPEPGRDDRRLRHRAQILPFLWNVFVSLRSGKIAGDDPWEATRSSGRPPRRRRRTTSTTCRRSAPSAPLRPPPRPDRRPLSGRRR